MVLRRGVFSGDRPSGATQKTARASAPPIVVASSCCDEMPEIPTRASRTFLPTRDAVLFSRPPKCRGQGVLRTGTVLASTYGVNSSCNVGWLLLVLRARRRERLRARRAGLRLARRGRPTATRGRLRLIAGGSDAGGDVLRQSVRARLADGRLFVAGGMSVARRGTGRPCVVCGAGITRDTVEREVEGPADARGLAHEECYRIWREESRRTGTPEATGSPCPAFARHGATSCRFAPPGPRNRSGTLYASGEDTMPTSEDVPRCEKCGRALATRLRREVDRVRTYLECPDCTLPSGGQPESGRSESGPPENQPDEAAPLPARRSEASLCRTASARSCAPLCRGPPALGARSPLSAPPAARRALRARPGAHRYSPPGGPAGRRAPARAPQGEAPRRFLPKSARSARTLPRAAAGVGRASVKALRRPGGEKAGRHRPSRENREARIGMLASESARLRAPRAALDRSPPPAACSGSGDRARARRRFASRSAWLAARTSGSKATRYPSVAARRSPCPSGARRSRSAALSGWAARGPGRWPLG